MILNRDSYRKQVLGCWMGKNIGGTLGAPFEWRRQVNNVSFYTQDLKGEPLPNDDLDIQLLWLIALEERGPAIDAKTLGEYWLLYVGPHWAEYGIAKINMRSGLLPPLSGAYNNPFKDSCGAFIRSEIWACIAPGLPQVAARYAFEDAILDHGNGEGTYAAVFTAALESAAFVEKDLSRLIDIALSYIPADCGVAGAVKKAVECYRGGKTWRETRDEVLRQYRGSTFFGDINFTSPDDRAKGFAEGKLGWDAPSNIGLLILGLLYGEGDFEKSLCITVNCGEDTDCTGATAGSIFGILHGIDAIPKRWIEPIGRGIKTLCLNLGDLGGVPGTVDVLTDRTERMARRVLLHHSLPVEIALKPTDLSDLKPESLLAGPSAAALSANLAGPTFRFDFFDVCVDCGDEPTIRDGAPKEIRLRINNTYKIQANLNIRWLAPESWRVSPSRIGQCFSWRVDSNPIVAAFILQIDRIESQVMRLAVEITIDGRPGVMLVPVVLLNGNLQPQIRA
jgi:ADP-ribosylglycohydrolase